MKAATEAVEGLNSIVTLAIVVGIGIAAYYIRDAFANGALSENNPDNVDPSTGQYVGPLNALNQYVFPVKNPGGGQTVGTSETYTGAFSTSVLHPWNTLKSILGFQVTTPPVITNPVGVTPSDVGGAGGGW